MDDVEKSKTRRAQHGKTAEVMEGEADNKSKDKRRTIMDDSQVQWEQEEEKNTMGMRKLVRRTPAKLMLENEQGQRKA